MLEVHITVKKGNHWFVTVHSGHPRIVKLLFKKSLCFLVLRGKSGKWPVFLTPVSPALGKQGNFVYFSPRKMGGGLVPEWNSKFHLNLQEWCLFMSSWIPDALPKLMSEKPDPAHPGQSALVPANYEAPSGLWVHPVHGAAHTCDASHHRHVTRIAFYRYGTFHDTSHTARLKQCRQIKVRIILFKRKGKKFLNGGLSK